MAGAESTSILMYDDGGVAEEDGGGARLAVAGWYDVLGPEVEGSSCFVI